ncbi:MAG: hypothetical protein WD940_00620 [Patescibacteria group bacterium]
MIFVFQGEDQPALRESLLNLKRKYPPASFWEGDPEELSQRLVALSLFGDRGQRHLAVWENPPLKELTKSRLEEWGKGVQDLALVFSQKLTAGELERFAGTRVLSFTPQIPKSVFPLLDALVARNRRSALLHAHRLLREGNDLDFLLKMIVWQLRVLARVKSGAVRGLNPYVVKKLQKYAGAWDQAKLRQSLSDILAEDRRRKRGVKIPIGLLISRLTQ